MTITTNHQVEGGRHEAEVVHLKNHLEVIQYYKQHQYQPYSTCHGAPVVDGPENIDSLMKQWVCVECGEKTRIHMEHKDPLGIPALCPFKELCANKFRAQSPPRHLNKLKG